MPKPPGYLPTEPDTAKAKEPNSHPHNLDHPVDDEREEEIEMDDDAEAAP